MVDLKIYRYRLPLVSGPVRVREGLVVETEVGFGEIAPLPGRSRETLDDALLELRSGREPRLPSVRFGLACAQKPLCGVHLPLWALGPRAGFQTVKLKLGHLSVNESISLVRKHLGKHLRLDCNRAWNLEEALFFAKHFKPTDFASLEEPVRTWPDLIRFSEETGFPIALDEQIGGDWAEIPTLKAIVVKPTLTGEIPKLPPHLQLILSSSYESGLGLLHIARISQEIGGPQPVGIDTYGALEQDLLISPIRCERGFFSWTPSAPLLDKAKLCPIAL